jgi:glycosyltransferase involved in cell wall biosynthesis
VVKPQPASATPRVSVIIATYNRANVLAFAIGSVLDQTFADFELLVVGDGCTDESAVVVAAVDDLRMRWHNLDRNTGHQSGPNNEGLRRSAGDIVAYLGHDDLWLPHHLELLVAAVDAGAPSVHGSVLEVHPGRPPFVTPLDDWRYCLGDWIPPTSLALTRSLLLEVGPWRPPAETGRVEPEAELLARTSKLAGPPEWVRHVTSVKFAASKRRDVYRTRPAFEQEHWLRVIREAPDPEAALLATVGVPDELAGEAHDFEVPLPIRVWRSMRFRALRRLGLATALRASVRHRDTRRFKGL